MDDNNKFDDQNAKLDNNQSAPVSAASDQTPLGEHGLPQYGVIQSFKDALAAIKANIITFTAVVLIGGALAIFVQLAVGFITLAVIGDTGPEPASKTFTEAINAALPTLILSSFLLTVTSVFIYAWLFATSSIAVVDGANGIKGSTAATLLAAMRKIIRVALAQALLGLVVIGPAIAIQLVALALMFLFRPEPMSGLVILYFLMGIASVVWMIIAVLRYYLMPHIALFEPDVPLKQTPSLSRRLTARGGQRFLVKLMLLYLLMLLVLSLLIGGVAYRAETAEPSAFVSLIVVVFAIISNAMIVMLYRNRRQIIQPPTSYSAPLRVQ